MHVLNQLRTILKDSSDTVISRDEKLDLLTRSLSFYNQNIINRYVTTLPYTDGIHYTLPTNFYKELSIKDNVTFRDLPEDAYLIDEFEKTLTIMQKYIDDLGAISFLTYRTLDLEYSIEYLLNEDIITSNIIPGSNSIIVSDISKYFVNAEIILTNGLAEETVKVTSVDTLTNTIIFSSLNSFTGSTIVLCDIKLKQEDKDIIVYYAGYLSLDLTTNINTTIGSSTFTQGKITYTTSTSNSATNQTTGFLGKVNDLLKVNKKYVKNIEGNSITSLKVTIS